MLLAGTMTMTDHDLCLPRSSVDWRAGLDWAGLVASSRAVKVEGGCKSLVGVRSLVPLRLPDRKDQTDQARKQEGERGSSAFFYFWRC